jgi:fluoride exporter
VSSPKEPTEDLTLVEPHRETPRPTAERTAGRLSQMVRFVSDQWLDAPPDLDPEVEPAPDATHAARPTMWHAAIVFVAGGCGVLARDVLLHVAPASRDAVPWMLVAINVTGAALLGVVVARVIDPHPRATKLRLLLATGLLGGFTSYSSLVTAAVVAGHDGHLADGFVTLLGTSVVGVIASMLTGRGLRKVTS